MLVGQFCQQWQHRFLYPQIPQSANKKPHSANQKTLVPLPLSITQLLKPTKNSILLQHSLPLPMEPLSPKGMVYLTSSSDEEEDSLANEEEEK
jgi:hypothetical protein